MLSPNNTYLEGEGVIEILPESQGDLVAARASGKLTADDYTKVWLPRLEQEIRTHGKVRALLYLDETFDGFEIGAMWEDAKFGLSHADNFDKVAVVGAPEWVDICVGLVGHLMKGSVKSFPAGSLEEAHSWIK